MRELNMQEIEGVNGGIFGVLALIGMEVHSMYRTFAGV